MLHRAQGRGLVPGAGGGALAVDPGVTLGKPDHPQAIGSQLPGGRWQRKDPQNHTVYDRGAEKPSRQVGTITEY